MPKFREGQKFQSLERDNETAEVVRLIGDGETALITFYRDRVAVGQSQNTYDQIGRKWVEKG